MYAGEIAPQLCGADENFIIQNKKVGDTPEFGARSEAYVT